MSEAFARRVHEALRARIRSGGPISVGDGRTITDSVWKGRDEVIIVCDSERYLVKRPGLYCPDPDGDAVLDGRRVRFDPVGAVIVLLLTQGR